ncbi:hypothetical protein DZC30_13000 [Comamonas testosteroni]|uniref:Uncharacterized protein n=1 Tax=Comamonas testosteroni TaxID=285 RepID=A0A373FLD4_COMTE|nr:hypothetical protein DZC30_13000 [Comamonas testosteroni]
MLSAMQFVFEDSEVARLELSQGAAHVLTVHFSAARVLEGTGKSGSGEGAWMRLLLICKLSAQINSGLEASGRLEGGCVRVDGAQSLRTLPVPYEIRQPLKSELVLELEFARGEHLRLHCLSLEIRPVAAQCATESFQC